MVLRGRTTDRGGLLSGTSARQAIIDIGSNTVRLVVYGGSPRAPTVLLNEKVAARLGSEITATGRMGDDAMALAMRGLERYAVLLGDLGIDKVDVVATAAVRDAANGPEFLDRLRTIGFAPRLLSGEEEAQLSAWGVKGAFPGAVGVVADLGGGSLELVRLDNAAEGDVPGSGISLPLGTLRLPELKQGNPERLRKAVQGAIKDSRIGAADGGNLYLVGGTWRAMAVYAMERRSFPLTDPHGLSLLHDDALALARHVAERSPEDLRISPRISAMRAASMPDAAALLQVLVKRLAPHRVVVSSWGLREGIVYSGLAPHTRTQDPLIAGVSTFAASRGASPTMAALIASWTLDALPPGQGNDERWRLAATMLALASMQVEPNLRLRVGIEWALHKRWIAIPPEGRAMLAAAICANANRVDLPGEIASLADRAALERAIGWGLAIRLCRRLGSCTRNAFRQTRLGREGRKLVLSLEQSRAALYGLPNEKDLATLAGRFGLEPEVRLVADSVLTRV